MRKVIALAGIGAFALAACSSPDSSPKAGHTVRPSVAITSSASASTKAVQATSSTLMTTQTSTSSAPVSVAPTTSQTPSPSSTYVVAPVQNAETMPEAQAKELFIARIDSAFRVESLLSSNGKSAHLSQAKKDSLLNDLPRGCKDITLMDVSQRDALIQAARNDTSHGMTERQRVTVATAMFDMCTNVNFQKNHANELGLPPVEGAENYGVGD